jgi:toxin ParE1/3/4
VKPVRVRPLADADIDAVLAYVRKRSPAGARRLLASLEQNFERLSRDPGIGSSRYAHVLPVEGLHVWQVVGWPYLIFYLERSDHLDVVRVLHGARDIPSALEAEPPA